MANEIETVIEDSLNDALVDDLDTGTDEVAAPGTAGDADEGEAAAEETAEVAPPSAVKDNEDKEEPADPNAKPEDEFAKRFGLQAQSITGRENRIPYSRVKKIIEKNERETIARVTKELETKFAGGNPEVQGKVQDYEARLTRVGQFEQIMVQDPRQHLSMLAGLPAYKDFFEFVNKAFESSAKKPAEGAAAVVDPASDMPQPDRVQPDGTRVYSMEGLKALMDWQGKQVETRVNKSWQETVDKRFGPIEQEWKSREKMAALVPEIDKQITEARKWPNFSELEGTIVELLNRDQNMTLEGAYRQAYHTAVVPKLAADRNKIRSEVLAEIQKKPAATATTTVARPKAGVATGPRSTEDIIRGELEQAGLLGK